MRLGTPINIRGVEQPRSGFHPNTLQTTSIVDKAHPITQGLGESFEIADEAYTCPMFEDSVKPLMRTQGDDELDSMGGFAGSAGLGQGEPDEDLQVDRS